MADLRKENQKLKEMVADLMLRYTIVKKKLGHAGLSEKYQKHMRLTAAEKQEIIWMVERSDLGVNRTLKQLGVPKTTFFTNGIRPIRKMEYWD